MTSQKQIDANRKNAQRSTGPKTPAGKKTVAKNAVTHGILARDIVIEAIDGPDSAQEYATLLDDLREACQPVGRLEEILVEEIAESYWTLLRVKRAEKGLLLCTRQELIAWPQKQREVALRQNLRDLEWRPDLLLELELYDREERLAMQTAKHDAARRNLRQDSLGLQHLIETVTTALTEVEATESLDADTARRLAREFGTEPDDLYGHLKLILEADGVAVGPESGLPENEQVHADYALSDRARTAVLRRLRDDLDELQKLRDAVCQQEREKLDAVLDAAAIPTEAEIQRIQRYHTTYHRQMHNAMARLEQLQRRRLGEASIPPISLSVSRDE